MKLEPFHVLFGMAHAVGALFAAALLAASIGGTMHHTKRIRGERQP